MSYILTYVCMYVLYVLYVCNSFMLVCVSHYHVHVCALQQR